MKVSWLIFFFFGINIKGLDVILIVIITLCLGYSFLYITRIYLIKKSENNIKTACITTTYNVSCRYLNRGWTDLSIVMSNYHPIHAFFLLLIISLSLPHCCFFSHHRLELKLKKKNKWILWPKYSLMMTLNSLSPADSKSLSSFLDTSRFNPTPKLPGLDSKNKSFNLPLLGSYESIFELVTIWFNSL